MRLILHELRRGRNSLLVWAVLIGGMLCVCVCIYPEMGKSMSEMSQMFADMGGFTAAFGMDKVQFGTLIGFFAVECGTMIGLGGGFFAALLGISALAKEEQEHTAEFLLTHPISRFWVAGQKLAAVYLQILILNLAVFLITILSVRWIGESLEWKTMGLLLLANLLLQLEIGGICFGLSAYLRRGSLGAGLGVAILFYFMNLIANLTESANFLKYVTPFGYGEGADIAAEGSIHMEYLAVGIFMTAAAVAGGFYQYRRKDIF